MVSTSKVMVTAIVTLLALTSIMVVSASEDDDAAYSMTSGDWTYGSVDNPLTSLSLRYHYTLDGSNTVSDCYRIVAYVLNGSSISLTGDPFFAAAGSLAGLTGTSNGFAGTLAGDNNTSYTFYIGTTPQFKGEIVINVVDPVVLDVSNISVLAGQPFSQTVAPSGTVTVSGQSWVHADGQTIYGTAPTTPGTYNVTVSLGSSMATMVVTVVSVLAPTSTPSNGALIFVSR